MPHDQTCSAVSNNSALHDHPSIRSPIFPNPAILEVGLGGRLDAVNIIDADCAVITSIDLDHMEFLGNDRESIGREKAGIMRTGRF